MQTLMEQLNQGLVGAPIYAWVAAFLWGVMSVLLSPCHLASIPLIVGFISDQGETKARRAFGLASSFAIGILVTIVLIGVVTASLGRMLGDVGTYGNVAVAVVFLVFGLHLLEVYQLPFSGVKGVGIQRKGLFAALILGLVFGVALGPCTFAFMAPMLGVVFQLSKDGSWYGGFLLAAYGLGHCGVIVIAGTSVNWVQRYLTWNQDTSMLKWIKRGCGVFVIVAGLWMLHRAP